MKIFYIVIIMALVLGVYHRTHEPRAPQFNKKLYHEWIDKEVGRPAYNNWKLTQALSEFEQDRIRRGE